MQCNMPFGTHGPSFGTHAACYEQRSVPILPAICRVFYAVQHAVRYPQAPVRYPCCLLRTAFGTHPACYLHRFCTHRNKPFGTQGPRSAPKGSKLRDPYRKSRFPLWPVNNLTAIMGGTGPGWKLIQDHQHSIVWGARPPNWPHLPLNTSFIQQATPGHRSQLSSCSKPHWDTSFIQQATPRHKLH